MFIVIAAPDGSVLPRAFPRVPLSQRRLVAMPDIPSLDLTRRVCAGDAFLHGVPRWRVVVVGHPPADARPRVGCP